MRGHHVLTASVLEVFLEHSTSAAFLRDTTGVYLWVNQAYADLYGVAPERMVGADLFAFDPPLLAAMYLESDQSVLRSGASVRHTLPMSRLDGVGEAAGHRFRVPLPDQRTGVGGIYTDVTELHRVREELGRHKARYATLFDRSAVALAVVDSHGVLREVNRAFAALAARSTQDLLHAPLSDLVGNDAVAAVLADESVRTTVGLHLRDGSVLPATASATTEPGGFTTVLALQPLPPAPQAHADAFSDREVALVELMALGADNTTIASRLHLSRQGLDYHIRRLRRRLRATTRVDLVSRAYAAGVLDPSSWPPRVSPALRRTTD